MMSGIKAKDTKPELLIRRALFSKGFRYKLHDKNLPGKPDLVFPKYSAVIFVHGCFWHKHNCHLFKWPKTNKIFWRKKLSRNNELDIQHYKKLKADGWYILVVWECALKGKDKKPLDWTINHIVNWLEHGGCDEEIKGEAA